MFEPKKFCFGSSQKKLGSSFSQKKAHLRLHKPAHGRTCQKFCAAGDFEHLRRNVTVIDKENEETTIFGMLQLPRQSHSRTYFRFFKKD